MGESIHPKITYFITKECTPNWRLDNHKILYYDLVFVLEGSADYIINGNHHHVQKGNVVFMKPQSDRAATTTGMVCVAFDFALQDGEEIDLPVVSHWLDLMDFQWLFKEINFEWLQRKEGYQMKCQAIFSLILHKLLYERRQNGTNIHVETIKRYIVEHYEEKLTVNSLAKVANINPVYCGALFKQLEGRSISDFINRVRINKAASLLETGEYNIGEVAEKTGFKDIYYFSSTFKRLMRISPKSYRNGSATTHRLL